MEQRCWDRKNDVDNLPKTNLSPENKNMNPSKGEEAKNYSRVPRYF